MDPREDWFQGLSFEEVARRLAAGDAPDIGGVVVVPDGYLSWVGAHNKRERVDKEIKLAVAAERGRCATILDRELEIRARLGISIAADEWLRVLAQRIRDGRNHDGSTSPSTTSSD